MSHRPLPHGGMKAANRFPSFPKCGHLQPFDSWFPVRRDFTIHPRRLIYGPSLGDNWDDLFKSTWNPHRQTFAPRPDFGLTKLLDTRFRMGTAWVLNLSAVICAAYYLGRRCYTSWKSMTILWTTVLPSFWQGGWNEYIGSSSVFTGAMEGYHLMCYFEHCEKPSNSIGRSYADLNYEVALCSIRSCDSAHQFHNS